MSSPAGRVAVTGSSGLLGANLVFELSRRGCDVAALYGRHAVAFPGVPSFPLDLDDREGMVRTLTQINPAWIVHCAAAVNLDWCEAHPDECMRINACATRKLAATANRLGARLIYISTDAVFDGDAGGYIETDAVAPVNRYALSKAAGETAVLQVMSDALVLRLNIYGWNLQPKTSLAEWVLGRLESATAVPGFRDIVFSPVLVNDAAVWILQAMRSGLSGIYHLASSDYCTKYAFAKEIASVFVLDDRLVEVSSLADAGFTTRRPRNTWLCARKISTTLGIELPTVRAGIERFRAFRECGLLKELKAAAKRGESTSWPS